MLINLILRIDLDCIDSSLSINSNESLTSVRPANDKTHFIEMIDTTIT